MRELPTTIGSKRNRSIQHLYLRLFYRLFSLTGLFYTTIGKYIYGYVYILFKKITEKSKWDIVCDLIKPETIVLDVGANIGAFTNNILKKNKEVSIVAIEPDYTNNEIFNFFFSKEIENKNITLIKKAATEKIGDFKLHLDTCNPGGHVIADTGVLIEGVTIDELLKNENKKVSLIKIDVEGYEEKVILGSMETIKKFHPTIFLEYNPLFLKECGSNPFDLLEKMLANNYRLFTFAKNNKLGERSIDDVFNETKKTGWTDILMIPKF